MKKLSERLEDEADSWDSWNRDHLEDGCFTTPPLLREAAELARRFEAAPTVKVRGEVGEVCMAPISHDFCGNSVRIVPEKEGR